MTPMTRTIDKDVPFDGCDGGAPDDIGTDTDCTG
jgi:hypothetical protein